MNIDESIRTVFRHHKMVADALKEEVDPYFQTKKQPAWHYESRVKSEESLALKIEAGMVRDIAAIEDMFGATLVVPNAQTVADAEALVEARFGPPIERRPPNPDVTNKQPESFRFDDVRLYVRYTRSVTEQASIREGAVFEVQIKTFLQHAWSVATHDVVYKADNVDWRRERISYQVKASLEQAEVAVGSMVMLAKTDVLPSQYRAYTELNAIIDTLRTNWSDPGRLPADVKRLAEVVEQLLKIVFPAVGSSASNIVDELDRILNAGRATTAGAHRLDRSPYRSVLAYVADDRPAQLKAYLKKSRKRDRLLVYPETLTSLGLSGDEVKGGTVLPIAN